MRLLLDTHIFIWWDSEPTKRSTQTLAACEDPANTLLLSVASVWEMQIKLQLGKLHLRSPLPDIIREQQEANNVGVLPVQLAHVLALAQLPAHHNDPFDRLLIAQALAENVTLLRVDTAIATYPVKVLS